MREKSGFSSDVTSVEIDRLIGQTEMNWYTIAVAAGAYIGAVTSQSP